MCKTKSIICATSTLMVAKEDNNFIADGWVNIFLKLCIFERRENVLVKSNPFNAWKDGSIWIIDSPNPLATAETSWYVITTLIEDVPWWK